MGRVYRAYDERLERWVAAKCLHRGATATARKRFRREAHTLARLGHPAIVQIFDIVEDVGDDWIIMEMIDGQTLGSLSLAGGLEWREVADYGRQILSALDGAHSHGIVHRDLKTDNVMVLPSGHVKVLDFGLAYHVGLGAADCTLASAEIPDVADPGLTEPGRLLGTPRTMAPEQILELDVDARTDLYAFGILLYEVLAGRAAFTAKSVHQLLHRIVQERLPPLHEEFPSIPRELSELIDRLLEKDPAQRPQTAAEVGSELATLAMAASARSRSRARQPTDHDGLISDSEAARRSHGERRQLTVLCVDLARPSATTPRGSTPDVETLSEMTPVFQKTFQEVILRYQGTVSKPFGNRFIAFFGYPIAHEDSAIRAVHAGLDLIEEGPLEDLDGAKLSPRIGIHTGPVVISPGQAWEPVAFGSTLDQTLEAQTHAGVESVVVSDVTRQIVERSFSLEAHSDDGDAWRVLAKHSRRPADATVEMPPLVAREQELDLMLSRWRVCSEGRRAQGGRAQGRGQVMLISGEAGIGKSRLLWAFRHSLLADAARWWTAYGTTFQQDSPLAAIADMLRREILPDGEEESSSRLDRLEAFLDPFGLMQDEVVPLFTGLLELPNDGRYSTPDLPPNERRRQTLEALVALFSEMAEQDPWVLAIEDLHWMDPSSLELLERLIKGAASSPLCLVATCRPDGLPSWETEAVTRIHLDQMGEESGERLIDLVGGESLTREVREQILSRADGVPLFLEELTKAVLESESEPQSEPQSEAIPSTLRDSLTARLDRLGTAKEVAETASAIGRTFTLDMLRTIDPRGETTLRRELDRLIDAGLIFRKGFRASERFLFKHALIHDIAYDSLLRKDRRSLHHRLAESLVAEFDTESESDQNPQPELIAHHYSSAGEDVEAVPYWRRAGHAALAESAQLEALHHFERALESLTRVKDRSALHDEELTVLSGLGTAQILNFGFTAPAVEETWNRAHAQCLASGDAPSFDMLWGLYTFRSVRGEWRVTPPIIEQMLRFAEDSEAPILRLQNHFVAGIQWAFTGRPRQALEGLETAASYESEDLGQQLIRSFAIDSRVMGRNYRAIVAWLVGDDATLHEATREAVELARSGGHAFTRSTCSLLLGILHLARRDAASAEAEARAVIELSRRHGLYQERDARAILACSQILKAEEEEPEEAGTEDELTRLAEELKECVGALVASGSRVWTPLYLSFRAEALMLAGDLDSAEAQLESIRDAVDELGEEFWLAELVRLGGEVARRRGDRQTAEELFEQALAIATAQEASALVERARASLK